MGFFFLMGGGLFLNYGKVPEVGLFIFGTSTSSIDPHFSPLPPYPSVLAPSSSSLLPV